MPKYVLNNNVDIWQLNISQTKSHYDYFYNLLSKDEKLKVERFKFKKDRITSTLARGVLRLLLSKYLNCPTDAIIFKYGKYGKPELVNNKTAKFNVSHAGEFVVMALSENTEVGVDIEQIRYDFNIFNIVNNYFSKTEIEALHKLPRATQTEAFFRGWTRKEAFIKAKSQGLSFPLDSFSVSIDSDIKAELIETLWDKSEKSLWQIVPFETAANYKAALAVKGQINTIEYFKYSLDFI
ncbi:4'-phosphopantetheinyl transferase superfamily protein [Hyunsoonleella flava]|uniref:4'-phosphopantetheinyl transferase superfamily protein n=1 Tax=Hyunsoonleella flava TaxID=2527939 RepID=A0A4Q9FFK7_9FLAO|nr:4'-phosphopantetheinyl transferase superfamily protein [Hyunsoonleella flava]TBN04431.1 4'-phosphopantetheinyl transferase superfamily protein [Hyunsoonleella flava]